MRHNLHLKSAMIAISMILSGSAVAGSISSLPQDNCFTWTLVGAQQVQNTTSHQWLFSKTSNYYYKSDYNSYATDNAPAHLGFYIGPANNPPASIVGEDFKPNLVERIKYGFYLVSTF